MALLWAAGIIWFAVDYAESKEPPANTTASSDSSSSAGADGAASSDDVKTAADALGM